MQEAGGMKICMFASRMSGSFTLCKEVLGRGSEEDLFLCDRGLQFEMVLIYLGMQGRTGKAEQSGSL
jgi:hypothetical protein